MKLVVKRPRANLAVVASAFVPLALLVTVALVLSAPTKSYPPGTPLLYDDFEYSATKVETMSHIGSEKAPEGKTFFVVDIEVTNKSKRTDHTPDLKVVEVSRMNGTKLSPDPKCQVLLDSLVTALGTTIKRTIGPGEKETYRTVYVGSLPSKELSVKFCFGGSLGTFFDNLIYGKRQIVLHDSGN